MSVKCLFGRRGGVLHGPGEVRAPRQRGVPAGRAARARGPEAVRLLPLRPVQTQLRLHQPRPGHVTRVLLDNLSDTCLSR